MWEVYWEYYLMGIILIPGIVFAAIAQARVQSSYNEYNKIGCSSGRSAYETARLILDTAGLQDVQIKKVAGNLTDYYDHKNKVLALSETTHDSTSIAAVGVAAHEVGHALQYKTHYVPIKVRSLAIGLSNISSTILWPLVIIGLILSFGSASGNIVIGNVFLWIGIGFFGLSVLVNLATLPVEYDASRRATKILADSNTLTEEETEGAKKVLNAAALTYVASLLVSILNLLRFVLVFARRNNKD